MKWRGIFKEKFSGKKTVSNSVPLTKVIYGRTLYAHTCARTLYIHTVSTFRTLYVRDTIRREKTFYSQIKQNVLQTSSCNKTSCKHFMRTSTPSEMVWKDAPLHPITRHGTARHSSSRHGKGPGRIMEREDRPAKWGRRTVSFRRDGY